METAPLTLAHAHARSAAKETKLQNHLAASEEHELAATEFAATAKDTSDHEALRILNLLEQHHKKLGEIIKIRHERPGQEEVEVPPAVDETPASIAADTLKQEAKRNLSPPETPSHAPRLPRTGRSTTRDLSSSIASNLASARGIPGSRQKPPTPISPLVSNQHADGQITQDDGWRKPSADQASPASIRPSWAPPLASNQDKVEPPSSAADAPFTQFYSALEGLMSKLSAPLAFAGLPLTISPPKQEVPSSQPTLKAAKAALISESDYSHMISRAALKAAGSGGQNPAESFYVVPTSGGTTSYAEMVNRADRAETYALRHHRIPSVLTNISEDSFVDARSTMLNQPRHGKQGANETKIDGKTVEEIAIENKALRKHLDTVSKRLHVFEMLSQTSTAALAQSIRSMPRSPLATPETSRTHSKTAAATARGGENLRTRVTELEEILKRNDQKARKREEENARLRETLGKYREKWDNLKAGAKARRETQTRDRDKDGGEGGAA